MQTTTNLLKYVKKQKDLDGIKKLLKDNSLFYNLGYLFCDFEEDDYETVDRNRKVALMYEYEIVKLSKLFSDRNIYPIFFKGLVLSRIIYGSVFERMCNDLDIYVQPNQFDETLELLLMNGYRLRSEAELNQQHHVVLIKAGAIVLELHKNIYNPQIGVNEALLKKEICNWNFRAYSLSSFNVTGTFLHLLYHLYMDTWLYSFNLYSILVTKSIRRAPRFLYRAYEIALFSEKYFEKIDWEKVVNDVQTQKLRIIFKKMLLDVIAIFPETFPPKVLNALLHHEYCDDQRDEFYKYLIKANVNGENSNYSYELCDFINENWDRRERNIHIRIGSGISLSKEYINGENVNLTCEITTSKVPNGILLTFEVPADDICISDLNTFDTQSSDGIHLILCGTANNIFSYNSIFLFPKLIDGKMCVVACDVLKNSSKIIDNIYIQASFEFKNDTYLITALLSNEYILRNNMISYFYMGILVSDCSNETKRRKNQLILSEDNTQWYNPVYFARVDVD